MLTAYNIHQMLETEKFRTWLENFNDLDDVGYTREDGICPIAEYLTDTINANPEYNQDFGRVSVGETQIIIYRTESYGELIDTNTPPWVSLFISLIDELPARFPFYQIIVDDETGEDYISDQPSDNVPVRKEIAIKTLDETIERLTEMQCESEETMLKEYSLYV